MSETATVEKENTNGTNMTETKSNKTTVNKPMSIDELVSAVWKGDVRVDKNEANRLMGGNAWRFVEERIITIDNHDGTYTFSRNNPNVVVKEHHKYMMPDFTDEVRCLVKRAVDGKGMCNICLSGPAGSGKSEFVREIANEFGLRVFQVNGSEGLTSADFYGSMSVSVDEKTKQNYTFFEKGQLYRAFIEGTELDEDGHQVFDAKGEPIVTGKPGVFFLDEFAAMLPEVFLGVFNRAMEIPRQVGRGRSIEITLDNGRVVKSHPSMVLFLAGNTVGTGNSGKYQMGYTAQGNKMDESTRNRITAFYQFGYNKLAEEAIALNVLNDDYQTEKLMTFCENIRTSFLNERVETLFTTRSIVAVCEAARAFRDGGLKDWMTRAMKVAVYNSLPENDKVHYNEMIRNVWAVDIMANEKKNENYSFV